MGLEEPIKKSDGWWVESAPEVERLLWLARHQAPAPGGVLYLKCTYGVLQHVRVYIPWSVVSPLFVQRELDTMSPWISH